MVPSPGALQPPSPKPAHLQPLDSTQTLQHSSSGIPTTPKSNLGSQRTSSIGSGAVLRHSDSSVSLLSTTQALQQHQQQQQQQQSDDDNIKVVVRIRPLFPQEQAKGATSVIQVAEDCSSLQVIVPGPGGSTMQRDFSFHACLGPEVNQAEVMDLCGIHQLLDAALAGYHVTIFAYGQTGSGKTHTMSGKEDIISDDTYMGHEHDGIVSRAVQYLFHQVNTRRDAKYSLKASYLEIYNEGVYDLVHFSPKAKSLPVKWDASYGFYVQGLKVVPCSQARTMMEVIRTGMKHRKVGSHQLNMESSRSHAMFTVYCDATPTDQSSYDYGTIRYGKLSFVDLAGSERVKDSKSEGTMLKETININKSLSVLGKVILALAERDAAGTTAHVPYRDSKLTKLLMDSLGGSALTLMVACCSPSSLQVEETLSTLSYATRTKKILNRPTVQYDPREAQISLLRREIELLRQENTLLKEQLRAGTNAGSLHNSLPTTPDGSPSMSAKQGLRTVAPGALSLGSPGSPSSSIGSPVGIGSPQGAGSLNARSPSPQLGAAGDAVAGMRANSSPNMPRLPGARTSAAGAAAGSGAHAAAAAELRSSLNEMDLRANAARHAAASANSLSGNGNTLSSQELLRRLRETQALLIKFSEENSRLSVDNQRLQAGRNALSNEHASVLDEIDLLRGKLSQLEQSVLTAAGSAAGSAAGGLPGQGGAAAGAGGGGGAAAAGAVAAAAVDLRALLQNLGLGEEVVGTLSAVGEGPLGPRESEVPTEGSQQQAGGWTNRLLSGVPVAPSGQDAGRRSFSQLQSSTSSIRQEYSSPSSSISVAPGAEQNRPLVKSGTFLGSMSSRQAPVSAGRSNRAAAAAAAAAVPRSGSSSPVPSSAKSGIIMVNRTPLHTKSTEQRDDAITLGNPAGLAVLLGESGSPARQRPDNILSRPQ